jgi:hypothetical protein
MTVYLITYDLNRPGQDYTKLHEAIRQCGEWCHPLESTWLVNTNMNATQISNWLLPHMDANDYLLVLLAGNDKAGRIPTVAAEWANQRLAA